MEEVQEAPNKFFFDKGGERQKGKGKQKEIHSKARQTLGKFGKWFFLLLIMEQSWLSVRAASGGPQGRNEAVTRIQQGLQIKESSWTEVVPERWKQRKGEVRTKMQQDTLPN